MGFLDLVKHLVILGILVFVLLFLLVYFGWIRCCDIPGFCSLYFWVKGKPMVAIVYGDSGIGDPELLKEKLIKHTGFYPVMINIETLTSASMLKDFHIVFVERARKISTAQLKMFEHYVKNGGKLVWIGDAGTDLSDEDYICVNVSVKYKPLLLNLENTSVNQTLCGPELTGYLAYPEEFSSVCGKTLEELKKNIELANKSFLQKVNVCPGTYRVIYPASLEYGVINPWVRGPSTTIQGEKISGIDFSKLLGVEYITLLNDSTITIDVLNPKERLVRGYTRLFVPNISVALTDTSRFSGSGYIKVVANLNTRDSIYGKHTWPGIVVTNPYGLGITTGKVVYYAFPPEQLNASNLINNMMDFMICD